MFEDQNGFYLNRMLWNLKNTVGFQKFIWNQEYKYFESLRVIESLQVRKPCKRLQPKHDCSDVVFTVKISVRRPDGLSEFLTGRSLHRLKIFWCFWKKITHIWAHFVAIRRVVTVWELLWSKKRKLNNINEKQLFCTLMNSQNCQQESAVLFKKLKHFWGIKFVCCSRQN